MHAVSEIVVTEATKTYGSVAALDRVTLSAEAGSAVGLVGRSGCGKSTLLRLIAGLDAPDRGRIAVAGAEDERGRLERCALMPQADLLMPWRDALGNASLALENAGVSRREARATAAELFAELGLGGFAEARSWELSGGMRQRVAFARTLLAGKPVLLLDEPFGALDAITRAEMQEWLAGALRALPRTIVLVTHDLDEALRLCDRVVVLTARPDDRDRLASDAAQTAWEMLAGFAAAVAFGLMSAAALHFSATLRRAVYPLLVASQSVPVVAVAPVLVIYLGFGPAPKIAIVALVCFFPVTVNALDGLRSVDPEYLRVMRTLRGSRLSIFRRVELPWALPAAFSGARIAASYAAVAALFAEYAGGSSGLGETMQTATAQLDAPLVGAAVVVLAALALALFAAVSLVERIAIPWARRAA